MTAAGWYVDPTANLGMRDGVIGYFRQPLNEDFAVTAWFAWLGGSRPLKVITTVGVSYERSYRVWPYLRWGYPHSELRVGAEDLGQASEFVELWELDEVNMAVDQLVRPVLDRAIAWAEPFASIDTFLDVLSNVNDAGVELMDIPVVLAASGKVEEGRQALVAAVVAHEEEAEELLMEDFKRSFETWVGAGAAPTPPDG
jgi:hypothetical protein